MYEAPFLDLASIVQRPSWRPAYSSHLAPFCCDEPKSIRSTLCYVNVPSRDTSDLVALRHELHAHAELAGNEIQTARIITDFVGKDSPVAGYDKPRDSGCWARFLTEVVVATPGSDARSCS